MCKKYNIGRNLDMNSDQITKTLFFGKLIATLKFLKNFENKNFCVFRF